MVGVCTRTTNTHLPSALACTDTSLGPEKPLPVRVAVANRGASLPAFSRGRSCTTCSSGKTQPRQASPIHELGASAELHLLLHIASSMRSANTTCTQHFDQHRTGSLPHASVPYLLPCRAVQLQCSCLPPGLCCHGQLNVPHIIR